MKVIPLMLSMMIVWTMTFCIREVAAEPEIERTFEIQDINAVKVRGGGTIDIVIGDKETLSIVTGQSVIDKIEVDAKGSVLRIRQSKGWFSNNDHFDMKCRLTVKSLESLYLSGAIEAHVGSTIQGDQFLLNIAGAAKAVIERVELVETLEAHVAGSSFLSVKDIQARELAFNATGASNIHLAGTVVNAQVDMTGATHLAAESLRAEQAHLKLTGASDVKMHVEKALTTRLTGASNVYYSGDPKVDSKSIGGSSVIQVDRQSASN